MTARRADVSQTQSGTRFERDAIVTMLHVAGLEVEEERLDELSGLLEAAGDAATHLATAAARVPLSAALAEYDPTWRDGERRA
jgi:hypothetical protein